MNMRESLKRGIHLAIINRSKSLNEMYNAKLFNVESLYDPQKWSMHDGELIDKNIVINTQFSSIRYKHILIDVQSRSMLASVIFKSFTLEIVSEEYPELITKEVLSKISAAVKTVDRNGNSAIVSIKPTLCEEGYKLSLNFEKRFGIYACTTIEVQNLPMFFSVVYISFYEPDMPLTVDQEIKKYITYKFGLDDQNKSI